MPSIWNRGCSPGTIHTGSLSHLSGPLIIVNAGRHPPSLRPCRCSPSISIGPAEISPITDAKSWKLPKTICVNCMEGEAAGNPDTYVGETARPVRGAVAQCRQPRPARAHGPASRWRAQHGELAVPSAPARMTRRRAAAGPASCTHRAADTARDGTGREFSCADGGNPLQWPLSLPIANPDCALKRTVAPAGSPPGPSRAPRAGRWPPPASPRCPRR